MPRFAVEHTRQNASPKHAAHATSASGSSLTPPLRGHATASGVLIPMGAAGGPAYECHLCGAAATVSCGACSALFYCGEEHRGAHWRDGGHGGAECDRMAADVAAAGALRAALPFPWAAAATEAIEAQRDTACAFLERAGVHGAGLWRRECACGTAGPFGACPKHCSASLGLLVRSRCAARRHAAAPRPRAHARRAVGAAGRPRARRRRGQQRRRWRGGAFAAA